MSKNKVIFWAVVGGLIVIGGAVVAGRYGREINTARETLSSLGSQVIETDCGLIEYAQAGTGSPVLVVHGAMGGFDQGLMLAEPIVAAGYQAISISRFGYLGSPLPEGATLDMQADAYACLLDALGIQTVAVMGVSAGATSSIRFAVRHPERTSALILLSPAAPGSVELDSPPMFVMDVLLRSDFIYWMAVTYFKSGIQSMIGVPEGFVLTPEMQIEVDETIAGTLPVSGRMDGMIFDSYSITADFYAEIADGNPYSVGQIDAPVLAIVALDDPLAIPENVRAMVEKIPGARLFTVPDGGHLTLGHAEEVNAEMIGFLNDHH